MVRRSRSYGLRDLVGKPERRAGQKRLRGLPTRGTSSRTGGIQRAAREDECNVVGFCIGGTLAVSALAYMAAKKDRRMKLRPCSLRCWISPTPAISRCSLTRSNLGFLDDHMDRLGYLDGRHMAEAFNLLRENDLIWFFVVNNYLLGREPIALDLLYWNSDSTRMPAAMHSFYLRSMYHQNVLKEPGGIALADVPIDLRKVKFRLISCRHARITLRRGDRPYAGPGCCPALNGSCSGIRARRRRYQPAHLEEIRVLDQRRSAGRTRRLGSMGPSSTKDRGGEIGASWIADHAGTQVPGTRTLGMAS